MKDLFRTLALPLLMLMSACASQPLPRLETQTAPPASPPTAILPPEPQIDYLGLQRALGLDRAIDELGYQEKAFDTCRVGFGFPNNQRCSKQYFVVIYYRLQCRDSEGTVSETLTENDIRPLANRSIQWSVRSQTGTSETNHDGFAQIRAITSSSLKQQRLKLATGSEFLYLRAETLTRVVTPRPWCDHLSASH